MVELIEMLIGILIGVLLAGNIYILQRVFNVYRFGKWVIERCADRDQAYLKTLHLGDQLMAQSVEFKTDNFALCFVWDRRPKFHQMLFSFKDLTLEEWFTEDQIKMINEY